MSVKLPSHLFVSHFTCLFYLFVLKRSCIIMLHYSSNNSNIWCSRWSKSVCLFVFLSADFYSLWLIPCMFETFDFELNLWKYVGPKHGGASHQRLFEFSPTTESVFTIDLEYFGSYKWPWFNRWSPLDPPTMPWLQHLLCFHVEHPHGHLPKWKTYQYPLYSLVSSLLLPAHGSAYSCVCIYFF